MIVVDTLNIFSGLLLLTRYKKDKKVFYVFKAKGRGVDFLIRWMKRRNWEFTEIDCELGPTSAGSDFIELQKEYWRLAEKKTRPEVCKKIDKCSLFSKREKEIIRSYLNALIETPLYQGLEILYFVVSIKNRFGMPSRVLLQSTPLKSVLGKEYIKRGIAVRFYKTYFSPRFCERKKYHDMKQIYSLRYNKFFVGKLIRLFFIIVIDLMLCVFNSFRRRFLFRRNSLSKSDDTFDICAIVPSRKRRSWFHDLNWRVDSKAKTWRVLGLIYDGVPDERLSIYRGFVDQWIDPRRFLSEKGAPSIYDWIFPRLFFISIRNLWRILRNIFALGFSWHLVIYLSDLLWEESKIEALFRHFQIKLLWTNIEGIYSQSTAAAIAIHRLGGVSLGSTWSVYAYPAMSGQRNTNDVFFAWGKRHVTLFQEASAVCQNFVISGYLGDFYLTDFQKKARQLRSQWQDAFGPRFVICYYDNIFLKNIYVTYSGVLSFFDHLLLWLKDHPEILFVFKSKKGDIFEPYPIKTKEILMEMEKKKQLIYCSEPADLGPGLASDLVIGLYLATLPTLLASYGKEVILFDDHRLYKEWPISDLKNVTFIEEAENIKETLNHVIPKAGATHGVGLRNLSPSELDPFCDGRATSRINDYFSDLLTNLKSGDKSDAAILAANERYRAKWGVDKVF